MIEDGRALRHQFVPNELVHRDGEIDALTAALETGTTGLREDLIITGATGVGKTSTTRYVLTQLERAAIDVETGYVNCISASTTTAALAALLRSSDHHAALDPRAHTPDRLVTRIRNLDSEFVAVLDEADVLETPDIIHALYEAPSITVVLITVNYDELFLNRDPRIENRLRTFQHIEFDNYSHQELTDIIQRRATVGLTHDALTHPSIQAIADRAAGDARLAITILRRAAKSAADTRRDTITPEIIENVSPSAHQEIASRYVDKLSTHQRLLFEIIRDHDRLKASALYTEYRDRASDPRADRTLRSYLQSMQREGLITQHGGGRHTAYALPDAD